METMRRKTFSFRGKIVFDAPARTQTHNEGCIHFGFLIILFIVLSATAYFAVSATEKRE